MTKKRLSEFLTDKIVDFGGQIPKKGRFEIFRPNVQ